ncbi:MAG: oligosaccharide flippase family protein [Pseudobutyrivibrio sp.]|nr:oligosaccharide flippase family protein [Pseudobutyrivibrio sp.]
MKEKNVKKNYIYNVAYQILVIITPLLTAPYVARVLGAGGIGVFSYVTAISAFFIIFATLGTSTYGQREISYVQNDAYGRSVAFWNTVAFRSTTTAIFLIIYGIFIAVVHPKWLIIYIIQFIEIINVACDTSWFFQGMEEFGKIVGRNAIFRIINLIMVFTLIKDSDDLALYAAATALITMAGHVSLWAYLPKYLVKVPRTALNPFKDTRTIIGLFLPTIAVQIYQYLDKIMIQAISSDELENGYYEQAMRITRMVLVLVTSMSTVMIPRIGHYYKEGNKAAIKNAMYKAYNFAWFLGCPLMFGLFGIAKNFIPWFYGPGYEKDIILLQIASGLSLAIAINNVTGIQYLVPTKREKLYTKTVVVGAVINFCFNLVLIPHFLSYGAAAASVIAEACIAILQLIYVRDELDIRRILGFSFKYLVSGAMMLLLLLVEGQYWPTNFVSTFIMIITGAAFYFGLLVLFKDQFFIENATSVISKIKGKIFR